MKSLLTYILLGYFCTASAVVYSQIDDTFYGEAAGLNNTGSQVSFFGRSAGLLNEGSFNSFFGYQAGRLNTTGGSNSFFGHRAGYSNTVGGSNTFVGADAGYNNISGSTNSFLGYRAGYLNTTGSGNVFLGFLAGNRNNGDKNTFVGNTAGENNTTGSGNSFLGSQAGQNNTTGDENVFLGVDAGKANTSGKRNSFVGFQSGFRNISGTRNTFLGDISGFRNTTGYSNVFIGSEAGYNNTGGYYNVAVGPKSGLTNESGIFNTFLGYGAGSRIEGDRNICIGYNAGPNNGNSGTSAITSSEKLYIDVQATDDPLIYGEFDNNLIRINGSFEATGGMANSSDFNLKTDFSQVDHHETLEKINRIEISKWVYKDSPTIHHIGPMAQDFYREFELGKSDKTISTIDADGIALSGIKALIQQRNNLLTKNEKLTQSNRRALEKLEELAIQYNELLELVATKLEEDEK